MGDDSLKIDDRWYQAAEIDLSVNADIREKPYSWWDPPRLWVEFEPTGVVNSDLDLVLLEPIAFDKKAHSIEFMLDGVKYNMDGIMIGLCYLDSSCNVSFKITTPIIRTETNAIKPFSLVVTFLCIPPLQFSCFPHFSRYYGNVNCKENLWK